ncbi:hypothetical protein SAMN06309944_0592 [Micrococcales bacterium KH10]|nr:hypothetical protein SAMN06309944_0592 [Micrococcales bacterium KH10]
MLPGRVWSGWVDQDGAELIRMDEHAMRERTNTHHRILGTLASVLIGVLIAGLAAPSASALGFAGVEVDSAEFRSSQTPTLAAKTTSKKRKQTIYTTFYSNGLSYDRKAGIYFGDFVAISVRGKKVAVASGGLNAGLDICAVGKRRSTAKRTVKMHDRYSADSFTLKIRGTKKKPALKLAKGWKKIGAKKAKAAFGKKTAFTWCG